MKEFNRQLICPWCFKGEGLTNRQADVYISVQCPKCKRIFLGDLKNLNTLKSSALKKKNSIC